MHVKSLFRFHNFLSTKLSLEYTSKPSPTNLALLNLFIAAAVQKKNNNTSSIEFLYNKSLNVLQCLLVFISLHHGSPVGLVFQILHPQVSKSSLLLAKSAKCLFLHQLFMAWPVSETEEV